MVLMRFPVFVFFRGVKEAECFTTVSRMLFMVRVMGIDHSPQVARFDSYTQLDPLMHNHIVKNKIEDPIAQDTYGRGGQERIEPCVDSKIEEND